MEELLKNATVRAKIKGLSPPVKKAFIESLLDLYEQETEDMIDVIEESRMELRGDYRSFEDDTEHLRAESRMLETRRQEYDNECVERYIKSRNESRVSYVDEDINSKAVKDYIKKRGKRRPQLAEDTTRSQSTDGTRNHRSASAMTTRSLPTPATLRTVEEEKDEVMKNLSSANRQSEIERQRQMELIAKRREQRRQQKKSTEEKALELLEKAVQMDKMLAERKQEHDEKLKVRLNDMKRKRAESRLDGRVPPEDNEKEWKEEKRSERKSEPKSDRGDQKDDRKSDKHERRDKDRDSKSESRSERKEERRSDKSDDSRKERRESRDKESRESRDKDKSERKERDRNKSEGSSEKKENKDREPKREDKKESSRSSSRPDKTDPPVADYDFARY